MEIVTAEQEESKIKSMVVSTYNQLKFGDVDLKYAPLVIDLTHSPKSTKKTGDVPWETIDALMKQMLDSSKQDIDYLVSIFNQRKAARDAVLKGKYRSGRIDFNRISRHEYSDSFFRQYNIEPECKNHGVFICLDMSGSMQKSWQSTIQQLMVVVEFCAKANVPYEVVGFTSDEAVPSTQDSDKILIDYRIRTKILNLLKTGMNRHAREELYSVLLTASNYAVSNRRGWKVHAVEMCSTPIMGVLIHLRAALRKFISSNRCAKNSLIFISDGGGDHYNGGRNEKCIYVSPMSGMEMEIGRPDHYNSKNIVLSDEESKFIEILRADFKKFELSVINFFYEAKAPAKLTNAQKSEFRRYGVVDVGATDGYNKMILLKSDSEEDVVADIDLTGNETAGALAKKMIGKIDNQTKTLSRSIMQILA